MACLRLAIVLLAVLVVSGVAKKDDRGGVQKKGEGGDKKGDKRDDKRDDKKDDDDKRGKQPKRRGPPPPPPPRDDLRRTVGDYMAECMKKSSSKELKKLCREEAKDQFENATSDDGDDEMSRGRNEAYFEKFQRDSGKKKAEDKISSCLKSGGGRRSQSQVESCMRSAHDELKDELDSYLQGKKGKSDKKLEKLRKEMEKEATRSVLGQLYGECMKAAGGGRASKQKKDECKDLLKSGKHGSGLDSEDEDSIMRRFFEGLLMKPAQQCDGDLKECRKQAKKEALDNGMNKHEYAAMKRMGEIKAAAAIWASCIDSGENDTICENVTREEFVRVSGSAGDDFDDKLLARVKRLAEAINNGEPLILVRFMRIVLTVATDSLDCNSTIEDILAVRALWVSRRLNKLARRALKRRCRIVDDAPEYSVKIELNDSANMTDEEMDNFTIEAAVNLAPVMNATTEAVGGYLLSPEEVAALLAEISQDDVRRLESLVEGDPADFEVSGQWSRDANGDDSDEDGGRRLESVDEVFAAQDMAECAPGDASCSGASPTSGSISPTPTPSSPTPPPTPTVSLTVNAAHRTAGWALVMAVLVAIGF